MQAVGVNGSGAGPGAAWRLAGSISVERQGAQTVLCLVGEVDGAVVDEFERTTKGRLPAVDAIDAGAATFLSSSGLRLLMRVREQGAARSRPVVLQAASPQVERVLEMARIADVFRRPPPA